MTADYLQTKQPDILEVIANLSNDAVFTPPKVVNAVLDLLPAAVWTDPTLRWLDPGAKTGVFPREITKRLMVSLVDAIPSEAARLRHIVTEMVFAVATEEITGLMSRRSLYCSKDASSEYSVVHFDNPDGNVWKKRVEHSFNDKGTCTECRGTREELEAEGRDNKAYGFIHADGRDQIDKEMNVKFDVVVGNPPYQMTGGGGGTGHSPLYNQFVDQAKALNPRYISMVIPSRWMAGGRGLDAFRAEMLSDKRIRQIVDYPNSAELFPTVDIKSGICYFLWERDRPGDCEVTVIRGPEVHGPHSRKLDESDVFVRDTRAVDILKKVQAFDEPSFEDLMTGAVPFGLTSNFEGYRRGSKPSTGEIRIYASTPAGRRNEGAVRRSLITKNVHLIDCWKVLIPKAGPGNSGGHVLPDIVLGQSMIAVPKSVCTETFLPVGPLESKVAAESVESYLKTRFLRFLVSLRKISQDAMRGVYRWVPQQTWDRTWTDAELYKKYRITKDEQQYVESMVRDMSS